MLKNEVRIFVHPYMAVVRREVAHYDVVAPSRALIVTASARIDSMGPIFLLRAERHDLYDRRGNAFKNAGVRKKVAGAFEALQGVGGSLVVVGRVEPKMRRSQTNPGVGGRRKPSDR